MWGKHGLRVFSKLLKILTLAIPWVLFSNRRYFTLLHPSWEESSLPLLIYDKKNHIDTIKTILVFIIAPCPS